MPALRHDTLLLALRALGRFTSAARRDAAAEVRLARLREACLASLGMELDVLTRFDARSVVALFPHPEQVRILARLVDEHARVMADGGALAAARDDATYAWALLARARQRWGVPADARAAEALEREAGPLTPLEPTDGAAENLRAPGPAGDSGA